MQTINFLISFFTKGLQIRSGFLSYFSDFSKYLKIQISYQISNFFKKTPNFKPIPKGRSQDAFKIVLWKNNFYQNC
jgi:hypothetical protein